MSQQISSVMLTIMTFWNVPECTQLYVYKITPKSRSISLIDQFFGDEKQVIEFYVAKNQQAAHDKIKAISISC